MRKKDKVSAAFVADVKAHVAQHGTKGWGLLRMRYPKVSDSTFWRMVRLVRSVHGIPKTEPCKAERPPPPVRELSGFVYIVFIDTSDGRFYKIGKSQSPLDRIQHHRTSSPFEVAIACVYFTENMHLEELTLHHIFSEKRVRGEWFRLDRNDIDLIHGRAIVKH